MPTTVYLIRHAQSDVSVKDDRSRPLTERGLRASHAVTRALVGRRLDRLFASPYKRAHDTLLDLARERSLPITPVEAFRERKVDDGWIDDFEAFARRQWADFDHKQGSGECLREVQARSVAALEDLLRRHEGEHFAIAGHGTALCTLHHAFEPTFGFEDFWALVDRTPFVMEARFEGTRCLGRKDLDLGPLPS